MKGCSIMYNCNLPCAVLIAGHFVLMNPSTTRHTRRPVSCGLTRRVVAYSSVPHGTKTLLVCTGIASGRVGVWSIQSCHVTYLVLQNVLEVWARDYYVT